MMFASQFPTEPKVKAATAAAGTSAATLSGAVMVLLTIVWPHMTTENKVLIAAAAPGALTAVLTFYTGWKAKHQVRPPVPAPPPVTPVTPAAPEGTA